jgi:hypothetical protein
MARQPVPFAPVFAKYESPFDDTAELASKYGFRRGFPLRDRLDAAAGAYLAFTNRRLPTPRERRGRLDLIEKEARAVQGGHLARSEALALTLFRSSDGLSGLAVHVEHAFDRDPRLPGARAVLPVVFDPAQVDRILGAVERTRRELKPRRSRPGDAGLRILVRELGRVWLDGTGRRAGATWNEIDEKHGEAVEFIHEACRRLKKRASREAVRHLLRRWREDARRARRK